MQEKLLFISASRVDANLIARMLGPAGVRVEHVLGLRSAAEYLHRSSCAVILTEATLLDGSWTEVLDLVQRLPEPPVVLVTDRLADHNLWAEVLNLGAYDLLAQPFDSSEVQRIVANACLQAAPRKSAAQPALRAQRALAQGAY